MIGQNILQYSIIDKLGEGGMGVVYKARDTKLDRLVALKFLPHYVASNDTERARFLQEAKAAAILNHPNVCVIYDIQETDGQQFIVMEYVDGMTMKQKFSESPLKISDAIGYAIQIGEALQEAHAKGIVHRDVKCENIMVNSKNQIKVMDFGLAKLRGSVKLTKSSSTTGTLAYMAPEQIQGGEVDARADIFSFGVVLYEMLAGQTPFRGEHEAAMMYSILNEEPLPIQKFRDDISSELLHVLHRALEKDPEERYQTVKDMTIDIRRMKKESTRVVRTSTADSSRASIGSPIEVIRARKNFRILMGIGISLAIIVALAIVVMPAKKPMNSIAVLPLINSAADAEMEYLSDGITEAIINNLTRIPDLRVIPRSTMFRFKGQNADPQEVGAQLKVHAVLAGRLVRRGTDLSVQLDLIDIDKESQAWGQNYHRSEKEILLLQDEITRDISKQLQLSISKETQKQISKRYTESTEAYKLYLKGRYFWNKRKAVDLTKAIDFFTQAIAADPGFALAYAGLADSYALQEQYADGRATETFPKAKAAAAKAVAIDPTLAEAHTSLGFASCMMWQFSEAEKEYRTSLEINPNYATTYQWYSLYLRFVGRSDEAYTMIQRAHDLDPLSLIIKINMGLIQLAKGNSDEAMKYADQVLEIDSTFGMAHMWKSKIFVKKGLLQQATAAARNAIHFSGPVSENLAQLGYCFGKAGKNEEARRILAEFEARYAKGSAAAYQIAYVYKGLGEKDKVFEWLEKSYSDHSGWLLRLTTDQEWDDLRSDPRFADLIKKIGLKSNTPN